jgi:hypothetical protein
VHIGKTKHIYNIAEGTHGRTHRLAWTSKGDQVQPQAGMSPSPKLTLLVINSKIVIFEPWNGEWGPLDCSLESRGQRNPIPFLLFLLQWQHSPLFWND